MQRLIPDKVKRYLSNNMCLMINDDLYQLSYIYYHHKVTTKWTSKHNVKTTDYST